ncbi:MAG: hypothetical protein ACSLE8_06205 [Rhodococcus sp. (in: high G+C Gram-positive bacteria)]
MSNPQANYIRVLEQRVAGLERLLDAVVHHIPDSVLDPDEELDNDPDLIAYVKKATDYLNGLGPL